MHSLYAENFDREIACTEAEWLTFLPVAIGSHPYRLVARAASVQIDDGQLAISWRNSAFPSQCSQRPLLVSFRHSGLNDAQRYLFMRCFDAHFPLQRVS